MGEVILVDLVMEVREVMEEQEVMGHLDLEETREGALFVLFQVVTILEQVLKLVVEHRRIVLPTEEEHLVYIQVHPHIRGVM